MQHTHHYLSAYRMFLDNKILGVGVKNFRRFCDYEKYKESRFLVLHILIYLHTNFSRNRNYWLLFLMSVLILFCKFIFSHILLKIRGKYYFTDFEICVLSGIAIYLWPFVPTGNIFNNWINIAMILNLPF